MSNYIVQTGDTIASIALKQYGVEGKEALLSSGNPGVGTDLTPGTIIGVPRDPEAPINLLPPTATDDPDATSVLIGDKVFRFWQEVKIIRSIDGMDRMEFTAPFDPSDNNFRNTFKPFTYQDMFFLVGSELLFTGTMLQIEPEVTSTSRTVVVSGYSLPGVLNDCTAPASAFPLEFDGQGIQEIAASLCAPFGLPVLMDGEPGAVFQRVAANPKMTVLSFLADLARQRNLIISSTPIGAVLFTNSVSTGAPVAVLKEGASPLVSVRPTFNPQQYFSHISGIEPVIVGLKGSQFTTRNDKLTAVLRPHTFLVPDTVDADVKAAVDAKTGRMFGEMVTYSVVVSEWRDPNGNLWGPNTTIKVEAPSAMVYTSYEFLIRQVEFVKTENSQSAILTLTLPGAYSGETPSALPWD